MENRAGSARHETLVYFLRRKRKPTHGRSPDRVSTAGALPRLLRGQSPNRTCLLGKAGQRQSRPEVRLTTLKDFDHLAAFDQRGNDSWRGAVGTAPLLQGRKLRPKFHGPVVAPDSKRLKRSTFPREPVACYLGSRSRWSCTKSPGRMTRRPCCPWTASRCRSLLTSTASAAKAAATSLSSSGSSGTTRGV